MAKTPKQAKNRAFWPRIGNFLRSRTFFIYILIAFTIQMGYIAYSTNYPMLFDEEYHLGIIDIYSRQVSPFITSQPPEAAFHGDITRYGSYLFHYVMSFPYRFITLFTNDIQAIVISLRFICIALVVLGMVMFRLFLLRAGVSAAITHSALVIFTLIPLVPFALSQLNYDALAFMVIPSLLYAALRTTEKQKNYSLWFVALTALALVGSLVKFTILPIAFAAVVFCVMSLYKNTGMNALNYLIADLKKAHRLITVPLLVIVCIAAGLFIERYIVNIIQHRNIEPKCDRIHTREECMQYTVWRRDTTWKEANDAKQVVRDNPLVYTNGYWAPHIFNDFFVVGALVNQTDKPLELRHLPSGPGSLQASAGNPVLRYSGWVIAVISLFVVWRYWRHIPHKKLIALIALVLIIYTTSLWIRNYTDYLRIGAGTAAQGRYFIPLLNPILAVVGLALASALRHTKNRAIILTIFLLLFTQGGGVGNYILYSNQRWYWQEQRQTITSLNNSLRKILRTVIPF